MSDSGIESYVLDSFAILALVKAETGSSRVAELLNGARRRQHKVFLGLVNLGEVLYRMEREAGQNIVPIMVQRIQESNVTLATVDLELAIAAAHIKARLPIAYADCFAIALAQRENATVVTGDPKFRKAEAVVNIEWLGDVASPE
jgi:ribonuclease VapC